MASRMLECRFAIDCHSVQAIFALSMAHPTTHVNWPLHYDISSAQTDHHSTPQIEGLNPVNHARAYVASLERPRMKKVGKCRGNLLLQIHRMVLYCSRPKRHKIYTLDSLGSCGKVATDGWAVRFEIQSSNINVAG